MFIYGPLMSMNDEWINRQKVVNNDDQKNELSDVCRLFIFDVDWDDRNI